MNAVPDNLLALIVRNADRMPEEAALREKRFGVWMPMTWAELEDMVGCFARGLESLGFGEGQNLLIVGDNKPEWIIAEFAAMAAGGLPTGAYPDSLPEEIQYLAAYSDATILVLRDQEQTDKIISIWDNIKDKVRRVIVWDSRGMGHYYSQYPFLMRFEEVMAIGKSLKGPGRYLAQRAGAIRGAQPAIMLTTSGTTARPKLSILSHENLMFASENYGLVVRMNRGDELLSAAPLAWIGEQLYNVVRFLTVGAHYSFPEETETLRTDLLELQPFYFGGTPAVWELIISTIQAAMDNADFFKRSCYRLALASAMKRTEAEIAGKRPGLASRLLAPMADFFVIRPLKNKVGLGRVRMAVTGGGAISPDVFKYFKALGIDLRQVFGQSECAGIATTHRWDDVRPETVGVPIPGVEVRISEEGEILVRGKNTHLGYYKNEKATREGYTEDGFLKTGDTGYFGEDGHLYVFDRAKDVMTLSDGTRFAPQDLETRLKFSPYIHEALVCGAGRPYVTAVVSIDMENVGNWAKKRGMSYTTIQDLSQRPEVYSLVKREIETICKRFPSNIRIKRFAILIKRLHPDDGELTRTKKLRRAFVNERYKALIDELYTGNKSHDLDIEIRYEDGRSAAFRGVVAIEETSA